MANIILVELTQPVVTRVLRQNARDASASSDPEDITGFVFKLTVKRSLDDPDSAALFTLDATIASAADGAYKFTFTLVHTSIPPDVYFGEIRYWKTGIATTAPPTDKIPIDFTIAKSVKRTLGT